MLDIVVKSWSCAKSKGFERGRVPFAKFLKKIDREGWKSLGERKNELN